MTFNVMTKAEAIRFIKKKVQKELALLTREVEKIRIKQIDQERMR